MGRPPKPRHLKLIAGTDRPSREQPEGVSLPRVDSIPEPPEWLPNAHAKREWERLAPTLVATGLLTDGGLMPFAHLCAVHGKLVQAWTAGSTPTGHLVAQYRAMCGDFGLTPIAQTRVTGSAAAGGPSRFDNNTR